MVQLTRVALTIAENQCIKPSEDNVKNDFFTMWQIFSTAAPGIEEV